MWNQLNVVTPFFLYKQNDYKYIDAEISLKTKHIVSIFWGWIEFQNDWRFMRAGFAINLGVITCAA